MTKAHAEVINKDGTKGQKRWDGREFSVHPEKVVAILRQFGVEDTQVLCAGYLHDTLEDTKLPEQEIETIFGQHVLHLVKQLTFKESKDDDEIYYQQCRNLSDKAKIIKIADILANITDKGHKSEHFIRKRVEALKILLGET